MSKHIQQTGITVGEYLSCAKKVRYSTIKKATKFAKTRYCKLRVYKCYICGGYHLTKSKLTDPISTDDKEE